MIKLKVHVSDNKRELTSKSGKALVLTECYVFLPNAPYPEKLDFFDCLIPAGVYSVPFSIGVYQGRLSLQPNFTKSEHLKAE